MKAESKCRMGYLAFGLSGLCAMSNGVIVSLLQSRYGFSYDYSGTLLSLMNAGNLAASFAAGFLPQLLGARNAILLLGSGYTLGYLLLSGRVSLALLALGFLLLGIAKGSVLNNCTILVGSHAKDRTRGMNLMHACYAMGALSAPILITIGLKLHERMPMYALAAAGVFLWLIFLNAGLPGKKTAGEKKDPKEKTDWSFLSEKKFWLLTALILCQNAAETNVSGWMVTYYKDTGILSGNLANYTVTILWGGTLIARLLIAFVFPIRDRFKAMAMMGAGCMVMYIGMMFSGTGVMAVGLLFLFAFCMAGVNPTAVSGAGKMLSPQSVGIMLPMASTGAILMPWITGMAAQIHGLKAGMLCNVIPCAGIMIFSTLIRLFCREE